MSVQTQIDRISGAVSAALTALSEKGVEVPAGTKVDGLAALIAAIEAGGGSGIELSNCQKVTTGVIVPSENISSNYLIHSGVLHDEIELPGNAISSTVALFVLFDITLGSVKNDFYNGFMAVYYGGIAPRLAASRGFYMGSSGSYTSLTSSSSIGAICNEAGSSSLSGTNEFCFNLYCTTTKMLLAGHSYCYMFLFRK